MSTSDEFASTLMKSVANKSEYHDVILVAGVDKHKISAHRLILVASSKYFDALLGPNFREGAQSEIPLEGINGTTLKTILDYVYSGHIVINDENIHDIIAAASSMELIALEKRYGEFWAANLSTANCVETFLYADKYHFKELWSIALKFICKHFERVPIEDIQQIDEVNLRKLFKHDQIIAAETVIFERFMQLIELKKSKSFTFVSEFPQLIRLEHIPIGFLIEKIEPLCQKYACSDVFIAEYRDRLLCSDAIRLYRYLPEEIYCSSCSDYYEGIDIQRYDFTENKWNQFKSELFDSQNCDFGSIFLNGELIIMGGQEEDEGGDRLKDVHSYNIDNWTNTTLLPMQTGRKNFTPICVGKYIYALGGASGSESTACERFDIEKRVWESIRPMPIDGVLIEFQGKIYVADGTLFFCYNPDNNSWSAKANISTDDKPWLAKTEDRLFAIESNWAIHQYEENQNKWTTIGWFGNFGKIAGIISHCNQIYILCEAGNFKVLKTVDNCTFIRLQGFSFPNTSSRYLFCK